MIIRIALAIGLTLFLPSASHSERRPLEFVQEIGGRSERLGWMSFVSFSSDGTMVAADGQATPDDPDNLALWSFPGGQLIKRLSIAPSTMSRDWKYYASFRGVGEVESDKAVISFPTDMDAAYAFSPDSHYLAKSSGDKSVRGSIRILELASGNEIRAFGRLSPQSFAIAPDGHILAAGYWNVVVLWDMFTGERLAALRGFGRYVVGMSFSQDGKLLAAGTDAGGLQIWDVGRRLKLRSVEIGGLLVSTPAFSPDGRLVAVGIYRTGSVWLIDVQSGKVLDHQKVSDTGCGSVAFSPDGRFLITPSTGGLIKWPYDHGGTIRVFRINAH